MDNFTHSLIGALIGQTGLKKLSGLGMATVIVAANIPDIDAACFVWLDGTEHLGFRRGITHGPLAMMVLPLVLTAAMVGFDRWQGSRGKRPESRLPVRPGQLFLLALIGTLSHPAFDWLNNYGIRLLEPFSSRWFYGDSIFIIDLWMWIILVGGLLWSRRAEKSGGNWRRRGAVTATILSAYVFANGLITRTAEDATSVALTQKYGVVPTLVVASPVPFAFWQREMLWRSGPWRGSHGFSLGSAPTPPGPAVLDSSDPRIARLAQTNPQVRAFLFWSRMPIMRVDGDTLIVTDQRFSSPLVGDRFTVRAPLEPIN